eukprot:77293-Rhodomonas_salina.1
MSLPFPPSRTSSITRFKLLPTSNSFMSSESLRLRLMRQSRTMMVKKKLLCMQVVVLQHWDSAFTSKPLFLYGPEVTASAPFPSRAGTSFVDGVALSVRNSELNSTLESLCHVQQP